MIGIGLCRASKLWFEATHDDNLSLRISPTRRQTGLNLPTFSGFGQFACHISSLGKETQRARFQQRIGQSQELWHRGHRPRRDHIDRIRGLFDEILNARRVHLGRDAGGPHRFVQERGFLAAAFNQVNVRPGISASAQAITKPGNPPPEPRSAQIRASGASARSCSESATWRVHSVASVEDATRFIRRCQARSVATKRSSRWSVSRETGVSARAWARSANRSGDSGDPERGRDGADPVTRPLARPPPFMPRRGSPYGPAGAYARPARSGPRA